jgi:hypothetical protein
MVLWPSTRKEVTFIIGKLSTFRTSSDLSQLFVSGTRMTRELDLRERMGKMLNPGSVTNNTTSK